VFPSTLSATGCYADLAARTLADGMIPYDVTTALWSDGLDKRRALFVPAPATISFSPTGAWGLPDRTILMKEFWLERTRGDPSSRVPIETRFLLKRANALEGYSYQWNDDGTDGILLPSSATKSFSVTEPGGATTTFTHVYPSREDCARCHTTAAGGTLGLQTPQMNRDLTYPNGVRENQLSALEHVGLFGGALPAAPPLLPKLAALEDTTAGLALRARSYLHANCAHCHLPSGPTPVALDLRFDTPLSQTGTCGATPQTGDLGVADARILAPADPGRSVLFLRMSDRGADQMPPLATGLPDGTAIGVLRDWITAQTSCP
jgi:uncharacterized repeat protein (TIGR03806 family)